MLTDEQQKKLEMLTVYVTSSHRTNALLVFDNIPESVRNRCVVVYPASQKEEYEKACSALDVTGQAAPEGYEYMAQKRQWCTEICPTPYFCMMDDDVTFFKRVDGKLVKADLLDAETLFLEAIETMEKGEASLVGISGRYMNNAVKDDHVDIARMHRIWFFDMAVWKTLGITICPFPKYVMDDFHIILSFLEKGCPNRVFYKWAQDHKGSNTEGGCSTFRNEDVMRASATWLYEQHPEVVSVVTKISKTGWEGMGTLPDGTTKRTDVNVQWRKAYRPRRKASVAPSIFMKKK